MKLYEKLCFKLGTKVGAAIYGKNLTPEQKRQLERQAYQEMLAEERMKASSSGSSGGSSNTQRRCCANCDYLAGSPVYGEKYFCMKHDIHFTYEDISRDVHLKSVCNDYWPWGG